MRRCLKPSKSVGAYCIIKRGGWAEGDLGRGRFGQS